MTGPQQSKGNCVALMKTTKIKTTAWHSTAEKEEKFLDLRHYTDLRQGGTTLHKLSHSTAIQKLQGEATRYSPLRH